MLKSIAFVSCLIIASCVPKTPEPAMVFINDPIINVSSVEPETTVIETTAPKRHCPIGMTKSR
jgi:hypothetical protein